MRALVALVGLATLFLSAPCTAQTRGSHGLRISVPTILQLRIDDEARGSVAEVPLAIDVAAGIARIDPGHTRIKILANTRWQLSAAFAPAEGSKRLALTYTVDGRTAAWRAGDFAPIVLRGDATCGWRETAVEYGLGRTPADGTYAGVITFTLARP